jgi:3-deoxy-D-manno-octulosonic-acid transferase
LSDNRLYYQLYQGLSLIAGVLAWPYFYWHLKSRNSGESFLPRLGLKLPGAPPPGTPRIWLHGVSVGEIQAAVPLVQELKNLLPQAAFIVSTGTETGQAVARQHFSPLGALVCYFPLDLAGAVYRYLRHLRPQVFVALESEIWPNFLMQACGQGVRLALANARMSEQSFRRYLKFKRFVFDFLNVFDIIAAGSPEDYGRLLQLGLSPAKVQLAGNLKCDRLLEVPNDRRTSGNAAAILASRGQPVFLAASTHPGEEEAVLDAYQQLLTPYPSLVLLLAPRHPERAAELSRLLSRRGLPGHFWTDLKARREIRRRPVVIIDTVGELATLYGLAEVAFVGGSLVPHGGQNFLEPAAWGLAPIYGPHVDNFRWAQAILEPAGAGLMVRDAASLAAAARDLLDHPDRRQALGLKAREALTQHQGAARRQAELIVRMIKEKSGL